MMQDPNHNITTAYVEKHVYKQWKDGFSVYPEHPNSWCMDAGGPETYKFTEKEYLEGKANSLPDDASIYILCSFHFNPEGLDDPEKYRHRNAFYKQYRNPIRD